MSSRTDITNSSAKLRPVPTWWSVEVHGCSLSTDILNKFLWSTGRNHASMGGISNIFESVKKLDESVLHVHKDTLTNPRPATGFRPATNLLRIAAEPEHTTASSFYMCSYCNSYVSASQHQKCSCGRSMTKSVYLLQPEAAESPGTPTKKKGYLKKSLTYIVTDTLDIMLSSTIKSIEILNKLKVEKMSDLQSITVSITPPQVCVCWPFFNIGWSSVANASLTIFLLSRRYDYKS